MGLVVWNLSEGLGFQVPGSRRFVWLRVEGLRVEAVGIGSRVSTMKIVACISLSGLGFCT